MAEGPYLAFPFFGAAAAVLDPSAPSAAVELPAPLLLFFLFELGDLSCDEATGAAGAAGAAGGGGGGFRFGPQGTLPSD